jgi:hypothetical protein
MLLLLLGRGGMSTMSGALGLLGGASMTTGLEVRGALMLGARLWFRDLMDMFMPDMPALFLLRLGVKLDEALDDVVEGS